MKVMIYNGETLEPEWSPEPDQIPEREGIPKPLTDPIPETPAPEWSPEIE